MTPFELIKRMVKRQVNTQPFLHKFLVNRNIYRKFINDVSIHCEILSKDIELYEKYTSLCQYVEQIRDNNYPIDKFLWDSRIGTQKYIFWSKVNKQYNKLYEKYTSLNK